MNELISDYLKKKDVEFLEDFSIARLSTVKIGGIADAVVFPENTAELISAVDFCKENSIYYKIVGRMSNLLFGDDRLRGVVIRTDRTRGISFDGCILNVACGESLASIACACEKRGLSGIEELSGIPSSIGGAVVGNAGAFGREICDLISYE